ncbi:heterokaryon incompatibility protein-domain-containing protein, partial [Achaetomium macrosporum]
MEDPKQKRNFTRCQSKGKEPKPSPYYDYRPLRNGWIRLLQIRDDGYHNSIDESDESDESFSSTIEVSLAEHPLSSCPEYTALSYTWGSPTREPDPRYAIFTTEPRCFPIICDGRILLATRNLRDFLCRLRQGQRRRKRLGPVATEVFDVGHGPAKRTVLRTFVSYDFLWIDALCIDQEDLHERACQVAVMNQIYTKARDCVVWLGELDTMERASGAIHQFLKCFSDPATGSIDPSCVQDKIMPAIADFRPSDALAVTEFLSLSWFSRVWILQESILTESILAMCGPRTM